MDPITLFGLAAAATFSGVTLAMGTKRIYSYIKRRRSIDSPEIVLREVNVDTNRNN